MESTRMKFKVGQEIIDSKGFTRKILEVGEIFYTVECTITSPKNRKSFKLGIKYVEDHYQLKSKLTKVLA